jgi:hypothetical protein
MFQFLFILLSLVLVQACTRSSIPAPDRVEPPILEEADQDLPPVLPSAAREYAVVWVPEREQLVVRTPAGIAGSAVGQLAYDEIGIQLTGNASRLGSSTWVEVELSQVSSGWVNRWNLTELVRSDDFCQDTRIVPLLERAVQAIQVRDGDALAAVLHPQRGLVIRHDWWNPDVVFSIEATRRIFSDRQDYAWGEMSGGGFPQVGSFRDLILPALDEVLLGAPQVRCDELLTGLTTREMLWPPEFHNLRFYAFYRPAAQDGNQYHWRTWTLGIEYVDGEPYLALLVQFRGDI